MDNRGLFGYEGEGFMQESEPEPDELKRGRDNFGAEPYGESERKDDEPDPKIPRSSSE